MSDLKLLSTKEAVKYLRDRGIDRSESWLHDHAKKGEIDFLRNPKEHFRFAPAFLDAYIDSQTDTELSTDLGASESIKPIGVGANLEGDINAKVGTGEAKPTPIEASPNKHDAESASNNAEGVNIPSASESSSTTLGDVTSDTPLKDPLQPKNDADGGGSVKRPGYKEFQSVATSLNTATLTFRQLLMLLGMIIALVALVVYFREQFINIGAFVSIIIFTALSLITAMLITALRNDGFELTKKDFGIKGVGGFFIASMAILYIGYEQISGFDERIKNLNSVHKSELDRITSELSDVRKKNSKLLLESNELAIHRAWLETSRLGVANNMPMSFRVIVQCGPNQNEPPEFYYTLRPDGGMEDTQIFASNEQTFGLGVT